MTPRYSRRISLLLFLGLCLILIGCSGDQISPSRPPSSPSANKNDSPDTSSATRDNTPEVLTPSADGKDTYTCDVSTIDASNVAEGYVMVNYTGTNPKVKLQITGPDAITYTYNLHGDYEVFPLTAGDGDYTVTVFENVSGTQYSTALSEQIPVKISNTFGPFLYPNQYVNFNSSSPAVAKAAQLAASASSDLDVVSSIYNYIIDNYTYDYDKAANVASGYLPDVDEIFKTRTGICFDYASVMTTMLRSQRIPTRLEIGYAGENYHAWISAYIKDIGWVNGIIKFDGTSWTLMDPTYASTSKTPEKFVADQANYQLKYVY